MRKLGEVWVPVIVLVFGAAYYHATRELPELSVAFPRFLMVLSLVLIAVILAKEWRNGRNAPDVGTQNLSFTAALVVFRNPMIVLGSAVLYLVLFIATNFVIATVVYLTGSMVALRVHWANAIVIACGFTFSLYGVFGYLFEVQI